MNTLTYIPYTRGGYRRSIVESAEIVEFNLRNIMNERHFQDLISQNYRETPNKIKNNK